jgi:hypothetical protein
MMGERRSGQDALFYEFSLERHVPAEHLLRSIDRFVEGACRLDDCHLAVEFDLGDQFPARPAATLAFFA